MDNLYENEKQIYIYSITNANTIFLINIKSTIVAKTRKKIKQIKLCLITKHI